MSVSSKITLKHIIRVLRQAIVKDTAKVPLGRWGLKEKNDIIDLSIMYSNEDHCGVCSGYAIEIQTKNKSNEELKFNEKQLNDEFICILGSTQDYNSIVIANQKHEGNKIEPSN